MTVIAALMIEFPHVQQTAVALHLCSFKTAPDSWKIILRPVRPLQNGIFFEIQFHIAVQPERTRHEYTCREIDRIRFRTVIDCLLNRLSVHGLPISDGGIRRFRNINPFFCPARFYDKRFRGCAGTLLFYRSGQKSDFHRIFRFRQKAVYRKVCLIRRARLFSVTDDLIDRAFRQILRLVPIQCNGIARYDLLHHAQFFYLSIHVLYPCSFPLFPVLSSCKRFGCQKVFSF